MEKKNPPYVVFSAQQFVKGVNSPLVLPSLRIQCAFWTSPQCWSLPRHLRRRYSRFPVWAEGQSINMNCVLHYFQLSEAVRAIIWAFSPTFCHLSPILGPRGHVKIESDSQSSMLNRLIGPRLSRPRSELFNTRPIRGLSVEATGSQDKQDPDNEKGKCYQTKTIHDLETDSQTPLRFRQRALKWFFNWREESWS